MSKDLYAALQIAEREIRILVSECYNTRFNILCSVEKECSGMNDYEIADRTSLKKAILAAFDEVKEKTGARLERVILLVPPIHFVRIPLKSTIVPSEKGLSKEDVCRALNKTLNIEIDPSLLVINRFPLSYTVNGITSKRLPLKEIAKEVTVDIDLLCADRKDAFDYVSLVEECGIEVMDICLSNYAIVKEAALFEQSLTHNAILLDINDSCTDMSLIIKNKLLSCEHLDKGMKDFVNELYDQYAIPYKNLLRLVKYNLSEQFENDELVFAYNVNEKNISITVSELNKFVVPHVEEYVDSIIKMCSPIIENGETVFYIVSEGADMVLIGDILSKKSGCQVKMLHPDAIGARTSNRIALYGSFFAEKEYLELMNKKSVCLNEFEFNNVLDLKKFEDEGETFTAKIKTFFKQNLDKEKA